MPEKANGLALGARRRPVEADDTLARVITETIQCGFGRSGGVPDISMESWARHGVLLLSSALTVRQREPLSHIGNGWLDFTMGLVKAMNQREFVVCVLMGRIAKCFRPLISPHHKIIKTLHPVMWSPVSGSGLKCFAVVNEAPQTRGREPVDWTI